MIESAYGSEDGRVSYIVDGNVDTLDDEEVPAQPHIPSCKETAKPASDSRGTQGHPEADRQGQTETDRDRSQKQTETHTETTQKHRMRRQTHVIQRSQKQTQDIR